MSRRVSAGTVVVRGRGQVLATATGQASATGIGSPPCSLRRRRSRRCSGRLRALSRILAAMAVGLCLVVGVLGLLRGQPWVLVVVTAISLMVAAVPESLPTVVVLSLALGASLMATHRADRAADSRPYRRSDRFRSSPPTRREPSPRAGWSCNSCGLQTRRRLRRVREPATSPTGRCGATEARSRSTTPQIWSPCSAPPPCAPTPNWTPRRLTGSAGQSSKVSGMPTASTATSAPEPSVSCRSTRPPRPGRAETTDVGTEVLGGVEPARRPCRPR